MLIGVNSNPKQNLDPTDLGLQVVRFPLWWTPWEPYDYESYAQALLAAGMAPLAVLDKPSFAYRRGTYRGMIEKLVKLYPSIMYWQIGNEPDGKPNTMSSTMAQWTFERILLAGRAALADRYMIAGAFARGSYNYVTRPTLVAALQACDGIAANLYGLRPEGFEEPGWGVGDLKDAYWLLITQEWAKGKDMWITEIGGEDSYFDNGTQKAAHHVASLDTLSQLGARAACVFCHSDIQVPEFGMLDVAGNRKPVYDAVKAYAAAATAPASGPSDR